MRLPEPSFSIPLSFFIGIVLTLYPLPPILAHGRPEWLSVLLIFWILNHPTKMGIWTAFIMGLVMDLLMTNTLGVYALSWSVVAYVARLSIRKARVLSLGQTSLLILVLIAIGLAVRYLCYSLLGQSQNHWQYWLPALTSACCWPFVLMSLQRWRRSC